MQPTCKLTLCLWQAPVSTCSASCFGPDLRSILHDAPGEDRLGNAPPNGHAPPHRPLPYPLHPALPAIYSTAFPTLCALLATCEAEAHPFPGSAGLEHSENPDCGKRRGILPPGDTAPRHLCTPKLPHRPFRPPPHPFKPIHHPGTEPSAICTMLGEQSAARSLCPSAARPLSPRSRPSPCPSPHPHT